MLPIGINFPLTVWPFGVISLTIPVVHSVSVVEITTRFSRSFSVDLDNPYHFAIPHLIPDVVVFAAAAVAVVVAALVLMTAVVVVFVVAVSVVILEHNLISAQ